MGCAVVVCAAAVQGGTFAYAFRTTNNPFKKKCNESGEMPIEQNSLLTSQHYKDSSVGKK